MAICAECGTDNPDVAKFCMACAAPLATAGAPAPAPPRRHEERRPVTAVFVDIVGSTSRAEQLDPEDVLALLEPYYERLRHVLEQHGGSVEKFIGDAVVALFGAPVAHEDDPERAVRSGLAIIAAIDALNAEDPSRELRVRVGITTGEAIVSLEARIGEGQGMAWGDVLNTAARLQSAAPINGVLVDERTYRSCRAAIEFEDAEPITAKGKAEAVPVWVAVRMRESPVRKAAETQLRRPHRGARSPDDGVEPGHGDRQARLRDRRRRAGARQEPAVARGDRTSRGCGRALRQLRPLRRGDHLLAGRADHARRRRHPRRRPGRRGLVEARRASSTVCRSPTSTSCARSPPPSRTCSARRRHRAARTRRPTSRRPSCTGASAASSSCSRHADLSCSSSRTCTGPSRPSSSSSYR